MELTASRSALLALHQQRTFVLVIEETESYKLGGTMVHAICHDHLTCGVKLATIHHHA